MLTLLLQLVFRLCLWRLDISLTGAAIWGSSRHVLVVIRTIDCYGMPTREFIMDPLRKIERDHRREVEFGPSIIQFTSAVLVDIESGGLIRTKSIFVEALARTILLECRVTAVIAWASLPLLGEMPAISFAPILEFLMRTLLHPGSDIKAYVPLTRRIPRPGASTLTMRNDILFFFLVKPYLVVILM
ncbi:hypothetical protein BKA93DRAFT_754423 [Sparassis latifolia]